MFIKYSPKDQRIKTIPIVIKASGGKAVPLASNSVILRPGTNELTETEWEAIKPHVQEDIKRKIIVPFTVEVEKAGKVTKARTLKDVPISVARKIIESCQNVDDLKKWVKQELPDEIMLLVLKRLRKFKIDPDELDDAVTGEEDSLDADITPEDGDDTPEDGKKGAKGTRKGSKKTPPFDPKPEGSEDEDDEIPDFDGSQGQE